MPALVEMEQADLPQESPRVHDPIRRRPEPQSERLGFRLQDGQPQAGPACRPPPASSPSDALVVDRHREPAGQVQAAVLNAFACR